MDTWKEVFFWANVMWAFIALMAITSKRPPR